MWTVGGGKRSTQAALFAAEGVKGPGPNGAQRSASRGATRRLARRGRDQAYFLDFGRIGFEVDAAFFLASVAARCFLILPVGETFNPSRTR